MSVRTWSRMDTNENNAQARSSKLIEGTFCNGKSWFQSLITKLLHSLISKRLFIDTFPIAFQYHVRSSFYTQFHQARFHVACDVHSRRDNGDDISRLTARTDGRHDITNIVERKWPMSQ